MQPLRLTGPDDDSLLQNLNVPLIVEVFAGRGSLSRAFTQAGFSVLSIDHDGSKAVVPMVTLDLTTSSGQAILWDILQSPNLLGIHLGLPCGTASLARQFLKLYVHKELQIHRRYDLQCSLLDFQT